MKPRSVNYRATQNKNNIGITALERSVEYTTGGFKEKSEMRSFKSNENIHKKACGSYYVVSANKASSVTLQSPGNESQG